MSNESPNRDDLAREALSDSEKDYMHALTDIYVELQDKRPTVENLIHAERRLAALRVKSYKAAEESSNKVIQLTQEVTDLTKSIRILTFWAVVIALLSLGVAVVTLMQSCGFRVEKDRLIQPPAAEIGFDDKGN